MFDIIDISALESSFLLDRSVGSYTMYRRASTLHCALTGRWILVNNSKQRGPIHAICCDLISLQPNGDLRTHQVRDPTSG